MSSPASSRRCQVRRWLTPQLTAKCRAPIACAHCSSSAPSGHVFQFLLGNDGVRVDLGRRGRLFVTSQHSYTHRVNLVISEIRRHQALQQQSSTHLNAYDIHQARRNEVSCLMSWQAQPKSSLDDIIESHRVMAALAWHSRFVDPPTVLQHAPWDLPAPCACSIDLD